MKVTVKRQKSSDSPSYWQSFLYTGPEHVTVSAVLDALNYTDDLYDIDGNPASRISWECSCLQAVCGGCAMIINDECALACATFIDEIKGNELILEPLSKFPVVADLIVDRSIIYESLNQAQAFIKGDILGKIEYNDHQYSAAKCLKCGLCLEVCPNYHPGAGFFGGAFANESYLLFSQTDSEKKDIVKQYNKHFKSGCSKALSCQAVCPAGIETLTSILRMNRK